jgi:hypothetical protein
MKETAQEITAQHELQVMLYKQAEERNRVEYSLGDTLDTKTSIALVFALFLGVFMGGVLQFKATTVPMRGCEIAAIVCLIIAIILSVFELFPRNYGNGHIPQEFQEWVETVVTGYTGEYLDPVAYTLSLKYVYEERIRLLNMRFTQNQRHNTLKSWLLTFIFGFITVAFLINVVILAAVSTGWRF